MINPRGTGKPAMVRRARFAPFPPAVSSVASREVKESIVGTRILLHKEDKCAMEILTPMAE
jgi:hypothetical protein